MGTLDNMQERGLGQNLEINTPPKHHTVKMHQEQKGAKWQHGMEPTFTGRGERALGGSPTL